MNNPIRRTDYLYTPLFCEENIWQLVNSFISQGISPETMQVLFFSNPSKKVVLFEQQRSDARGYVVWDYHVVLRLRNNEEDCLYDFDTSLSFPIASRDYFSATFPMRYLLNDKMTIYLREVPAAAYLNNFYSDRSHMRGIVTDDEFPEWPAILPEHALVTRLDEYWDMERKLNDGSRVLSLDEYMATAM